MYSSVPKISVKSIRRNVTAAFTISALIIVSILSLVLFVTLGRISDNKESQLLESAAAHLSQAIENFFDTRESECSYVFSNEVISSYSPDAFSDEEYLEKQQRINAVKKELSDISAGKCYNDFFIIYSDSSTIGYVSQDASELASSGGYKAYSDILGDKREVWSTGAVSKANKLFYLSRMNNSSIFVLSCYNDELSAVFPTHDRIEIIDYILTDEKGRVILSDSDDIKTGGKMPNKYSELFQSDSEVVIGDFYIGTKTKLSDGWYCYIISENSDFIPNYAIIAAVVCIALSAVTVITILTGILCFRRIAAEDERYAESEYIDAITGRLNEYGLDEKISDLLETSLVGSTYAFIIIGIKDSDEIKSTVSLRYWNDLRLRLAEKAEHFFEDRPNYIGRAYDDYIAVFADYSDFDLFKAHASLEKGCEQLWRSFSDFTLDEKDQLKLNIVVGASVYPDHGDDFDSLLGKARQAYKTAAEKENERFSVYKAKNGSDKNGEGTK